MPRNTANSRQTTFNIQRPSNASQPRRRVSFEDEQCDTIAQQGKQGKQGNAITTKTTTANKTLKKKEQEKAKLTQMKVHVTITKKELQEQ